MGVSIGSKLILHASLQPATADGIANLLSLLRHTFGCGCANSVRSSAEFQKRAASCHPLMYGSNWWDCSHRHDDLIVGPACCLCPLAFMSQSRVE